MVGLLSRERIVAGPGFNRWLVPPAALAIHLSIGQAYAFSVFKLPLTKVLGITQSTAGDWSQPELAWILPSPSSSSGCRRPPSAAGSSMPAHARAGWWPPSAGA